TAEDGSFTLSGLTTWALYSAVVRSSDSVAAFSIAVRPESPAAEANAAAKGSGNDVSSRAGKNEIRLILTTTTADAVAAMQVDAGTLQLQMMPLNDLLSALGLDGSGFAPSLAPAAAPSGTGGGGGGGGGGVGAGAAALGGLGALSALGGT